MYCHSFSVSCISCCDQPVMRRTSSSHCGTYCFSGGICFSGICGAFSVQPHILQGKGWRTGDFYDPLCRDPVVLRIFGIQFRNFYNGQDLAGKSCAGRGIFTIFISALYGDFYAGKTGISMEPGFSGKWSLLSVFLNGNHACPSSDGSICSA